MCKVLIPLFAVQALLTSCPPASADDPLGPRAIIDRAIEAHGGATKIGRFKAATWNAKGKLFVLGGTTEYVGQFAEQLPERQWFDTRFEARGQKIHLVSAVSGDRQWETTNGQKEHMSPAELAEERERMHADWIATLRPLLDRSILLAPVGGVEIDGRATVGVVVEAKGHRPVKLFFDKQSGLLLKSQVRERDVETGQESIREEFYSGYQEFAGLKYHTRTRARKDGKLYSESERTGIKPTGRLGDHLFAEP
jgi:hypothetical protein